VAVDRVYINDQGDGNANTYTLAVEDFARIEGTVARSGAALITYLGGLAELVLNAGLGHDTINVQGTSPLAPLTVNAGFGDDTINVGFKGSVADIRGPLTVNGGPGVDTVWVDDSADGPDEFYIVPSDPVSGTLLRNGRRLLTYSYVEDFEIFL
jgi:hypothetical protein